MFRTTLAALAIGALMSGAAFAAENVANEPPPAPWELGSRLAKDLPQFIPGVGTLYVKPGTLPAGPWLAYDREGRLVSTIYMIPVKDFDGHTNFADLPSPGGHVDHISIEFNPGHAGVAEPHYHIVLWHVPKAQERLVKK
jgi:hypothetical protein